MPSTFRSTSAYAAQALSLLLSLQLTNVQAADLNAMTYQGCFSSSQPLSDQGSYTYQTSGYCQPLCVKKNQAVLGLSGGSDCWCGDQLPAVSSKVDDSNCNTPCNGYDSEMCGGTNFWSVYLSGTEANVPSFGVGSGSSSSAASPAPSTPTSAGTTGTTGTTGAPTSTTSQATTTTAAPSVVTSRMPGQTIVVTEPAAGQAEATASPTPQAQKTTSGSKPNVVGIAVGVVIGVIAVAAIIAGLFFWLRHRRQSAAEKEYNRSNQVADFMRGGREQKPPPTGYSGMSDSRLDPEAGNRRNSQGSIADAADYSRKILRVANPDSS